MNFVKLVLAACILIIPTAALGAQTCADVYAASMRTVSMDVRIRSEQRAIFNQHCESNGETRQSSASADLTATIKAIDVGFSGSQAEAFNRMQQFCKTYNENTQEFAQDLQYNNTIAADAFKSFNECRALEVNGVYITHTIQEPRSIVISVDFNPAKTNLNLRAVVYDANSAQCKTTGLSDKGTPVILDGDTNEAQIPRPFSIICVRTAVPNAEGVEQFSRFTLAVDTNQGTYSLALPADGLLGFDLANAAKASAAKQETTIQQLQVSQSSMTASIQNLQGRLNTAGVEIFSFAINGEYNVPGHIRVRCHNYPAGEPIEAVMNEAASNVCQGRRTIITAPFGHTDGGFCGNTYFSVACLSPE